MNDGINESHKIGTLPKKREKLEHNSLYCFTINTVPTIMSTMNKILRHSKKHTNDLENLLSNRFREKEELIRSYENKISSLKSNIEKTNEVVRSLVMIARMTPALFLVLVEKENERWSVSDLKNIAHALHSGLKETKHKNEKLSTAELLYSYLILDPNASKPALVQVIRDLQNELETIEQNNYHGINRMEESRDETELDLLAAAIAKGKRMEKNAAAETTESVVYMSPAPPTFMRRHSVG